MKGRKILRYAYVYRLQTAGAGVYGVVSNFTLTPRFNLEVVSIFGGLNVYDSVTDQAIQAGGVCEVFRPKDQDNPGLEITTGTAYGFGIITHTTASPQLEVYYYMAAGQDYRMDYDIHLQSVTANAITVDMRFYFGYLCPEDYMSVDAFAANPT